MASDRIVLALDTASPAPAVALLAGGKVFEESLAADRRASEELLPAVRRCLGLAGVPLERVGRLAICAGPGSFTGLRVGLATAWGFSRAAGAPVETVSTLEAMAEASRQTGRSRVWSGLDAGRGEAVLQEFSLEGPRALAVAPARRLSLERARSLVPPELSVALPGDLLYSDGPALAVTPARALALAVAREPGAATAGALQPIYSRPSAAEEKHGAA